MSHSKLDMIRRFADEKELRSKLLEPLFQRMKFECLLNHGINEFGKDFVLVKNNELGIRKYIGVVVKKGNVSMSSSAKNSSLIDDISRQMKEVFTIKYLDTFVKQSISIDRAYFICDGNISDNAKRKIVEQWGNSTELFEKNTEFISGERLVELVESNWPLFYSSFTPDFNEYAEKLLTRLQNEDKGRSINIDSNVGNISEKYLHNNLYEITHDGIGKIKYIHRNPDNVFDSVKHILIVGSSGTGKSHLIRNEIRRLISNECYNSKNPRFKVFIKLSEISESELNVDEINNFIKYSILKIWDKLDEEYINNCISGKDIDFYLDGLDEIATEENRNIAINNINAIIANYHSSQVVVTTRQVSIKLKQGLSNKFNRGG